MRFIYVIAVYNEEDQLPTLVSKLLPFLESRIGSRLMIVDNGSSDRTWAVIEELSGRYPEVVEGLQVSLKGQGRALKSAMDVLSKRELTPDTWIVFSAADLPFGFTDVQTILSQNIDADLVIGSKAHRHSRVQRSLLRTVMTFVYRLLRAILLGMKTKDPQGSLIFRPRWLSLRSECDSTDFFFTTQLVYFFERARAHIVEVPIQLNSDKRPSRVNPIRDGMRVTKQIIDFAKTRGRLD